jgi:hypothetical protein
MISQIEWSSNFMKEKNKLSELIVEQDQPNNLYFLKHT